MSKEKQPVNKPLDLSSLNGNSEPAAISITDTTVVKRKRGRPRTTDTSITDPDLRRKTKRGSTNLEDYQRDSNSIDLLSAANSLVAKYNGSSTPPSLLDDNTYGHLMGAKRKEIGVKLVALLDIITDSIMDGDRLQDATLKDLVYSMDRVTAVLKELSNADHAPKVDGKGVVLNPPESLEDANKRIAATREQLKVMDAEYEEVQDADADYSDGL